MKTRSMGTQALLEEAVPHQSPTTIRRAGDWEELDMPHNEPLHEQQQLSNDIPAFVMSPVQVVQVRRASAVPLSQDCLRPIGFVDFPPVVSTTMATTLQPALQPRSPSQPLSQPHDAQYNTCSTIISCSSSDESSQGMSAATATSHVRSPSSSWDCGETAEYSLERPGLRQRRFYNNRHHRRKRSRDAPTTNDFTLTSRCRPARSSSSSKNKWLIPAEHPLKLLWDLLTIALSVANAYATHQSIRDRQFGTTFTSMANSFCEIWFVLDICLNFITQRPIGGSVVLTDFQGVVARYLTTWFVVDALSLVPGELLYIKPIIDQQNRRGFFKRSFFQTRAVIRVSRVLRGHHVKLLRKVAKHSKRAGMGGANRLLRVIIKYAPKYFLFLRNMKGVVLLRVLRLVHWLRKVWFNFIVRRQRQRTAPIIKMDDDTHSLTEGYDDDDFSDYDDDYYGTGYDDDHGEYYYYEEDENLVEDSFVDDSPY